MELQDFHQLLEGISGEQHEEAEIEFNELIQNDPALLFQLLVASIQQFTDKTLKSAMVFLKRSATLMDKDFLSIGGEEFHVSFQNSLLSLILTPITDINLVQILSDDISCFSSIYQQQWPSLSISLLELIFRQDSGLISPPPSAPLSTTIATDVLWRCINNESILLEQDEIIEYIFAIIHTILGNPISVNYHQFISTVKLTFSAYTKLMTKPIVQQIILCAVPIIEIIPQLPSESLEQYLGAISLFSDDNILFFFPDIENFITILVSLISDYQQTTDLSRNRCVNILTNIVSCDKYFKIIKPKSSELYELFLTVIGNCTLTYDSEYGLEKSNTLEVTEDAIQHLSEFFSETIEFPNNVSTLFTECLEGEANLDYVISNLIGFQNAVKCEGSYMFLNSVETADILYPIYEATILNADPKLRFIAVKSLNSVMKNFGNDWLSFDADDFIQMIAEAINNETDEIIFTKLVKSMKIYVTYFKDFIPYCDAIMELLEGKFEQMNENQQVLVLEVYFKISQVLKNDFVQYMQPIYELIETVLTGFDSENPNFPFDLFFECMKIGPEFSVLSKDEFNSISTTILTFISSITDLNELSSSQMDSINGALCAILVKDPSHFFPFASDIVALILEQASTDISFESFDPSFNLNDDYKYGDGISCFNSKTNMIEVFDISTINLIAEALNTLNILLINIGKVVEIENFCSNLVEVIQKNLTQNKISATINEKLFMVMNSFFLALKKNEMMSLILEEEIEVDFDGETTSKPIFFQFYLQQIKVVNTTVTATSDIQNFSECFKLLEEFRKSLLFFCKLFNAVQNDSGNLFSESLNATLELILNIYNKTIYVRSYAENITECGNNFDYVGDVESIVGSFFGPIFSTMNSLIDQESLQNLCTTTFSIQPQILREDSKLFLSPIVFCFWRFFISLHPACTREQAQLMAVTFRDMSTDDSLEFETTQFALSTAVRIVCGLVDRDDDSSDDSNRYGLDELIEPTIDFLNTLYSNDPKKFSMNMFRFVNKELIIMAQSCVRNNSDPSAALQLVINMMPIDWIKQDDLYHDSEFDPNDEIVFDNFLNCYNLRAALNLAKLVNNDNVEILRSVEGAVTAVAVAILLFSNIKSPDVKKMMKNLVMFYLNDQNIGAQVLESFQQLYKETKLNVNKAIMKMRSE